MKAIVGAWKTLTDSLSVVGQYRSYSVYPLLSYIIMLLVILRGIIPLFEAVLGSGQNSVLSRVLLFLVVYLAYGVLYFVIAFCNVALVTSIAARLDGEEPGLAVGIVRASQRIRLIGVYTLVSATLDCCRFSLAYSSTHSLAWSSRLCHDTITRVPFCNFPVVKVTYIGFKNISTC